MKKLAAVVLILFATSFVSAAFASGCMAAPRASTAAMGAQEQEMPCCALKAACMGGSCFASVHSAGCTADHGAMAVGQNAANDLVKMPAPAIVPSWWPVAIARDDGARPRHRPSDSTRIVGYADIYARTGRLLI